MKQLLDRRGQRWRLYYLLKRGKKWHLKGG